MHRVIVFVTVVLLGCMSAVGGSVEFSPDPVLIDPGVSTLADLEVTLVAEREFSYVDLVIGSNDVLITGLTLAPDLDLDNVDIISPVGFFSSDLYVGGISDPGHFLGPTEPLGTLHIDAAALAPGVYEVLADDCVILPGCYRRFYGTGAVHVIPEPATLLLVVCGVAAAARRRIPARAPP
jgi:hypothetical protein